MINKTITVGGLEIPYSIGDEFYTILEPDTRIRYDDHFQFKVVGPDTVEGILIQSGGIYVERYDDVLIPIIEIFKLSEDAEEFIASLGIEKLPFKENDIVYTPKGEDTISWLSIDYDRRKLLIHTDKGFTFTMQEWEDIVTSEPKSDQ